MLRDPDYSLRGLLGETLNVVTNLESNIFRSFAKLVAQPGILTLDYFAGRRKRYLKPLQLFIFCNIIFFFFQALSGFNSLRTPLYVHLNMLPYSRLARQMVGNRLHERGVTFKEYQAGFDAVIETQAKTLVFLMIPMFAVGLTVLYLRKKEYFVKHLVFGIHFFSFYLLALSVLFLLTTVVTKLASRLTGAAIRSPGDLVFTLIQLSLCFVYLLLAAKTVYQEGWLITAIKSFALIGVLAVVVQSYRLILFFTTFYSV
jgi:hypothetical protein